MSAAVTISFSTLEAVLKINKSLTITPTVTIDTTVNGPESNPNNRNYVYEVLNDKGTTSTVVTAVASGNSCQITAGAAPGMVQVRVTVTVALANGHSATASASLGVTVVDAVTISFSTLEAVLKINKSLTITPTVTIDNTVDGPESSPNNRNYVYEVLNDKGATSTVVTAVASGNSCQITAKAVPGMVKVRVTVTVALANGRSVTASASLVVTVVDANGDTNNPRPTTTDYPNYTGTTMPPLVAVQALLNDLMPDDTPNDPDANTTAAQLFGLDYEYFALAGQDNKRTVFQIMESNHIYQASCTAASHLRLKVSKEIILGDSISFTVTRGNTFSVSVNLNDKSDKSDTSIKDHGVTNISMTGVASKLQLEAFAADDDDYYSYPPNSLTGTNTGTNYVYVPRLKVLNLDYGRIAWFCRDRAISLEFMGLDHYRLTPDNAHFANYSEIRENQIPPTLLNKANNKSFDRDLLPQEENLGLLNGYFRDNGAKDEPGCMAQYHKINLPPTLLADPTLDTGGANILQFMHGKGRLAYDYMDGAMKSFLKTRDSNILMYVGPIVTESVACAAFIKLEYYAFMITNQVISALNTNTDVFLSQLNMTRSVCRFGIVYNQFLVRVGKGIAKYAERFGATYYTVKTNEGDVTTSVFSFENNVSFLSRAIVEGFDLMYGSDQSTYSMNSTNCMHSTAHLFGRMGMYYQI